MSGRRFVRQRTAGAVRHKTEIVRAEGDGRAYTGGGGWNKGLTGQRGRREAPSVGWSDAARRSMRFTFSAFREEDFGTPQEIAERLVMMTLTLPGDWRRVCPDGAALRAAEKRFNAAWTRRWGSMKCVWVQEYQPRPDKGYWQQWAPHRHYYVMLPKDAVLVEGKLYTKGNRETWWWPWAQQAWYHAVRSGDPMHQKMGVQVSRRFWGQGREAMQEGRTDFDRVMDYFWRESGKKEQKEMPPEWEDVGQQWGYRGVKPRIVEEEVSWAVAVEERRLLRKLDRRFRMRDQEAARRSGRKAVPLRGKGRRRANLGSGTVYGHLEPELLSRVVDFAEQEAARKMRRRQPVVREQRAEWLAAYMRGEQVRIGLVCGCTVSGVTFAEDLREWMLPRMLSCLCVDGGGKRRARDAKYVRQAHRAIRDKVWNPEREWAASQQEG